MSELADCPTHQSILTAPSLAAAWHTGACCCSRPWMLLLLRRAVHIRAAMSAPEAKAMPAVPTLDRAAFQQTLQVPALRIPKQRCSELMKAFRGYTLDLPKTRCIVQDGDRQETRLLLLSEKVADVSGLSPELQQLIMREEFEWDSHSVHFSYNHVAADAVLRALLPEGMDIPSSFEMVGHIAHVNLKDEALPYKHLIGQVLMDKNPHIKTVVNKLGSIENEYRVFQMEVIAGEAKTETEVIQHGMRFQLDFAKVYWNSRLESEHTRLVASFQPEDVIMDIMTGIGPFAVPAAHKGCTVYANDLNPDSAAYLVRNITINKLNKLVHPFKMDGRAFVKLLCATPGGPVDELPPVQEAAEATPSAAVPASAPAVPQPGGHAVSTAEPASTAERTQWSQGASCSTKGPPMPPPVMPPDFRPPAGGLIFQHAVMNLPASAVLFLDAFNGAFDPRQWRGRQLPMVHCYTFMKNETEADVVARVEAALGGKLEEPPSIHNVRDVAPNKLMLCVSFRIPQAVAFAGRQEEADAEPAATGAVGCGADGAGTHVLGAEPAVESTQDQAVKKQKLAH